MAWLEIEGLEAFYHRVRVLHGIRLRLDEGDFVAVIGSNGAGKTTLLRSISGLIDLRGTIRLGGVDVDRLSPRQCVARGIIHCPEGRLLFPNMSVHQNLLMGAFLRTDRAGIRADLERAYTYLPALAGRRKQLAGTLSGGEQQMLAVGRAIMGRPRLLTLDEPSFGLAPMVVATIFEVITRLNQEGVTILVVEQNATLALEHSRYTWVLEEGRMVDAGPSAEMARKESIAEVYLGMT